MAFFDTLTSAVTSKALAAGAGLTIAGAGVAGVVTQGVPAQPHAERTQQVTPEEDDTTIELEDVTDVDVPTPAGDDAPAVLEEDDQDEGEAEGNGQGADGREVSEAVHATLSGNDLRPGDEGFGEAVAENARTNPDFGQDVSEAAREANGSAERRPANEDGNGDEGSDEAADPDAAAADGRQTAGERTNGASENRGPKR